MEVNDAVRILKRDTNKDVLGLVDDIQTFPMNEERDVVVSEFFVCFLFVGIKKEDVPVRED